MNNVLINACGIKSLGGINVLKSSIEKIKKYSNISILISEESLKSELTSNCIKKVVVIKHPRFLHPFLPIFIRTEKRNWINSFDTTIHFANFGFKTKTRDIVFVQNILPFSTEGKGIKNYILKYLIKRSIASSSITVVQNEHVTNYLPEKFKNKIKNIGTISKLERNISNNKGVIAISNNLEYKNVKFIEKVMNELSQKGMEDYNFTIVTDKSLDNNKITFMSGLSEKEIESNLSNHNIFFHASSVETLCLPIFEAQSQGLAIVAPNLDYAINAVAMEKYLYKHNDREDAMRKIDQAIGDMEKMKTMNTNLYNENWKEILKSS